MTAPPASPASAPMPGGSAGAVPEGNAAANLLTGAANLCTGIANLRNSSTYRWLITSQIQKDCKFTAGAEQNGKISCVPATLPDYLRHFTEALSKYGMSALQLPMYEVGFETITSVWFSHTKWKVVRPNLVAAAVYGGTRKREERAAERLKGARNQDVAAQERAIGAGATGTAFVNLKMYQPISISYNLCQLDKDALEARCRLLEGELRAKEASEREEREKKREEIITRALEDQTVAAKKVAEALKNMNEVLTSADSDAYATTMDYFQTRLKKAAREGTKELLGEQSSANVDILTNLRTEQLGAVKARILADYAGVRYMHNLAFSFPGDHGGRDRVYNPSGKTDLKLSVSVQGEHSKDPHFTIDVELSEAPLFGGSVQNRRSRMFLRPGGDVSGTGKLPDRFARFLIKQ